MRLPWLPRPLMQHTPTAAHGAVATSVLTVASASMVSCHQVCAKTTADPPQGEHTHTHTRSQCQGSASSDMLLSTRLGLKRAAADAALKACSSCVCRISCSSGTGEASSTSASSIFLCARNLTDNRRADCLQVLLLQLPPLLLLVPCSL